MKHHPSQLTQLQMTRASPVIDEGSAISISNKMDGNSFPGTIIKINEASPDHRPTLLDLVVLVKVITRNKR